MKSKEFVDKKGNNLIIESNKINIFFKTNDKNIERDYYVKLDFDKDIFKEIVEYLEDITKDIWQDFEPREANTMASDYAEYYDGRYHDNGYLSFKGNILSIERPSEDCPYMYKFNKRRMESFIYDLDEGENKGGK